MVDIQRRAVLRSLAKAATASTSSGARSPHMYHHQVKPATNLMGSNPVNPASALEALGVEALDASDAAFFSALHSPPPSSAASSSSSAASSVHSPYAFHADQADHDALFAAYAAEQQPQDLDAHARDLYYPAPVASAPPSAPLSAPPAPLSVIALVPSSSPVPSAVPSTMGRGVSSPRMSPSASSAPRPRQGVKRPLPSSTPSPVGSAVSSMLAMRTPASDAKPTPSSSSSAAAPTRARASPGRRTKKEDAAALAAAAEDAGASSGSDDGSAPPTKKTKVSRERQLKINAASRRCRKKQKLELQFLRTHVVDLQSALKDQVGVLRSAGGQHTRVARLATFLEESIRQVEDMSSGGRPGGTPKASLYSESELQQLKATAVQALAEAQLQSQQSSAAETKQSAAETQPPVETPPKSCSVVRALDPLTGYASLSADRRATLLNIAAFMRNNISLESQSFSPEVISCLPIEMDGWQLRLAITEKNYTIHNCKWFPCDVQQLYDFCWDTNVASKVRIQQGKNDYCVVTPLDTDVAHVYSKTIGKWSLSVHGVANVSYNSLVCRTLNSDTRRGMICQQSVLEDRDFQDESTIPWLFKRWVVFTPRVVDGVEGCYVEAYRTASYATGRLIYKEDNTYDSFCEHLIRRYAESNALLERMMARDPRFQHVASPHDAMALDQHEETTSDRMVKDLLLF